VPWSRDAPGGWPANHALACSWRNKGHGFWDGRA
jgi:hypothetical protein